MAIGATSHYVFYDNVGMGSGPNSDDSDCETGALANAFVENAGICTFKLPCADKDNCGPQWHLHYTMVTENPEACPSGFQVLDLTYAQPGNVIVQGNKIIIQNLDTNPGPMLFALGGVHDFGSFNTLNGFAPLSIDATLDGNLLGAACLTPVPVVEES